MIRTGIHQPIWDPMSPNRTQISFVDITRAYFNAKIEGSDAPTFVSLPNEDPDSETMCGRLLRHMYGTRGAADGWQQEYPTALIELGFEQWISCPNVFHHVGRQIHTSVHGGDSTSDGGKLALDWFETEVAKQHEITISPRLGPGPDDAKDGACLNRVIRWCDGRIGYAAGPRQAGKLVAECGLECAKGTATPGVKCSSHELEEAKLL